MSENKKNVYTCQECGGKIVTEDVDEGVTPFMLKCRATEGCDGNMWSAFYRCDQTLPAGFEWFMPKSLKGYNRGMKEHISKGGLDLRKKEHTSA